MGESDYIVIQDATVIDEMDVLQGIKENGLIPVYTDKSAETPGLAGPFKLIMFSAAALEAFL